jgi:hypothetical protein
MKERITLLSILLMLAACGKEITDEYSGDVAEIFQEISLSEKLNLYGDDLEDRREFHVWYENGNIIRERVYDMGELVFEN